MTILLEVQQIPACTKFVPPEPKLVWALIIYWCSVSLDELDSEDTLINSPGVANLWGEFKDNLQILSPLTNDGLTQKQACLSK